MIFSHAPVSYDAQHCNLVIPGARVKQASPEGYF
jgi:hypothetical protein